MGRATEVPVSASELSIISIHALRGEGDYRPVISLPLSTRFQSTPSVGRATTRSRKTNKIKKISIHALRGEGDAKNPRTEITVKISIHALRGEGDNDRLTNIESGI